MKEKIFKKGTIRRMLACSVVMCMTVNFLPFGMKRVEAADGTITAVEDTTSNYVPSNIVNGGFESEPFMTYTYKGKTYTRNPSKKDDDDYTYKDYNLVKDGGPLRAVQLTYSDIVINGVDKGWNTTENKVWVGNLFEWWPWGYKSATDFYSYNSNITGGAKGTRAYVEMNNSNAAALYQDLTTKGGDVIRWTLEHSVKSENPDIQSIEVEIGKPMGNASGVGTSINTNIDPSTLALYTSSKITSSNGYGFGNSSELSNLSLSKKTTEWKHAAGIYVVPDNQTVTRFAFVSTSTSQPSAGNLLDEITFSTLIGNLHATAQADGTVKITGYWGDEDSSKKLELKIGDTVTKVNMDSVLHKNFSFVIPAEKMGDNTLVEVYHQDYESAKRLVNVEHNHKWTYTVGTGDNANKIIAKCSGAGNCTVVNGKTNGVTLTLSASSQDYSGSAIEVTMDKTAWENAGLTVPTIVYEAKEGSSLTDGKAVNAGRYTAKITVEGLSVKKDFSILKDIPKDVNGNYILDDGEVVFEFNASGTNAQLINNKTELIKMFIENGDISEEEIENVKVGDTIKVSLDVVDSSNTMSESAKETLKNGCNGYTIGQFLDIELCVNGKRIPNTTDKLSISVQIPSKFLNMDKTVIETLDIARSHDGNVELLGATYDENTQSLIFETDKFSDYAIVYKDVENKDDNSGDTNIDESPKTGDSFNMTLWVSILMISALGMIVLVVSKKKKENNK